MPAKEISNLVAGAPHHAMVNGIDISKLTHTLNGSCLSMGQFIHLENSVDKIGISR